MKLRPRLFPRSFDDSRQQDPTLQVEDEKLIRAIYAERGRKDAKGVLVHFSKNSLKVQQGVAARFVNELKDALKMLASEKPVEV